MLLTVNISLLMLLYNLLLVTLLKHLLTLEEVCSFPMRKVFPIIFAMSRGSSGVRGPSGIFLYQKPSSILPANLQPYFPCLFNLVFSLNFPLGECRGKNRMLKNKIGGFGYPLTNTAKMQVHKRERSKSIAAETLFYLGQNIKS